MAENTSPEEQKAIDKLTKAVASDLASGKKKQTIVKTLVKSGWSEDTANQYVDNVERAIRDYRESPEGRKVMADKYARHMLYGILWAVGGGAVTIVTFSLASEQGGTYFIAWGAILFGIIDFFKGLFGWLKYKS
jgi:hypothetical protein